MHLTAPASSSPALPAVTVWFLDLSVSFRVDCCIGCDTLVCLKYAPGLHGVEKKHAHSLTRSFLFSSAIQILVETEC
jgi:hypothetical protein